jgi:RNA polymerase sigma factor (sigma-70 family)
MYLTQQQFSKTYSDNYLSLHNYFKFKCNNSFEAEDLTQESFTKLWINREKIESGKEVAFLYTIAYNLFIDLKRKETVKYKYVSSKGLQVNLESPEFSTLYKEFGNYVNEKISEIPDSSREVFIMNKIEKKTYSEIAQVIGLSIKSVEKKMSIALKTYREIKRFTY